MHNRLKNITPAPAAKACPICIAAVWNNSRTGVSITSSMSRGIKAPKLFTSIYTAPLFYIINQIILQCFNSVLGYPFSLLHIPNLFSLQIPV